MRLDLRPRDVDAALEVGAHRLERCGGRAQVLERFGQYGGLVGVDRAPLDRLLLARLDCALHLRQELLALHTATMEKHAVDARWTRSAQNAGGTRETRSARTASCFFLNCSRAALRSAASVLMRDLSTVRLWISSSTCPLIASIESCNTEHFALHREFAGH